MMRLACFSMLLASSIGIVALVSPPEASAFGEIYEISGSATTYHFEGGSLTAAPRTKTRESEASAFIASNLDSGGKAYLRIVNAVSMQVDVDPAFPDPQDYTGLISSNGDFMMFTNDDGRAVQMVGKISFLRGTNTVTGLKATALILTGPLNMPSNFDHFSIGKIKTTGGQVIVP